MRSFFISIFFGLFLIISFTACGDTSSPPADPVTKPSEKVATLSSSTSSVNVYVDAVENFTVDAKTSAGLVDTVSVISSNSSVFEAQVFAATVSITAKGVGAATLTVTSGSGKSLTVNVNVIVRPVDTSVAQNVSATDGTQDRSITISWDAVSGASIYYIYKAHSPEDATVFTPITVVAKTSFEDRTVDKNNLYNYYVKTYIDGEFGEASASDTGYVNGYSGDGVVVSNSAPVINPQINLTFEIDAVISTVIIAATDADGDDLTFSSTGLPPGFSMSTAGEITGTPTVLGTYNVSVSVTDGELSDTLNFVYTIRNPLINATTLSFGIETVTSITTSAEAQWYSFNATKDQEYSIQWKDKDDDSAYSRGVLVSVYRVDETSYYNYHISSGSSESYEFSLEQDSGYSGKFITAVANELVLIKVIEENNFLTGDFSITVSHIANTRPVIATLENVYSDVNVSISPISVSATDPEGNTLSYSATGLPPGLIIDEETGVISGTPNVIGVYNIAVQVSDQANNSFENFVYTVREVVDTNNAPILTTIENKSSEVNLEITPISVDGSDIDSGDVLSYSSSTLPLGLIINASSGVISGTPSIVGNYNVSIMLSDGTDSVVTLFNYTVNAKTATNIDLNFTQKVLPEVGDTRYGYASKSLYADEEYVIVASVDESTSSTSAGGVVFVYKYNTNNQLEKIYELEASDAENSNDFGSSVTMNGAYIIVGDSRNGADNYGAAYVFKNNGDDTFSQIAKLVADDPYTDTKLGASVALDGLYVVVGSLRDSVYVFINDGSDNYSQLNKLLAYDSDGVNKRFGADVEIESDLLVVSAQNDRSNKGAVYLFRQDGSGDFVHSQKIVSPTSSYSYFGSDISLENEYLAIGESYGAEAETYYGTTDIYKYDSSDGNFSFIDKLVALDPQKFSLFGANISMSEDRVLVGAYNFDLNESVENTGALYLFENDGSDTFNQIAKITASDSIAGDTVGYGVSMSGSSIVAGTYSNASAIGALYVHNIASLVQPTLSVDMLNVTLDINDTQLLNVTVTTDGTTADTFDATSSDVNIVTVSISGSVMTLSAVSEGTASIDISGGSGQSTAVAVTVNAATVANDDNITSLVLGGDYIIGEYIDTFIWYEFDAILGKTYSLLTYDGFSQPASGVATLDIKSSAYRADLTTEYFIDADNDVDVSETIVPTSSEKVYIKIFPYSSGESGTFAIRVYESMNEGTQAHPIPLSVGVSHEGSVGTDTLDEENSYYGLSVVSAGIRNISISNFAPEGDLDIWIYEDGCTTVITTSSGLSTTMDSIEYDFSVTGEYCIGIKNFSNDNNMTYDVVVTE